MLQKHPEKKCYRTSAIIRRSTFSSRPYCRSWPLTSLVFLRWTQCPLRKVINHNYHLGWQSPSHFSARSFSLSSDRSIPHCPPVVFLFSFTKDQCGCQFIHSFRVAPQMKGPQEATAALPQIWPAEVNFQSSISYWEWWVAHDGWGERLI